MIAINHSISLDCPPVGNIAEFPVCEIFLFVQIIIPVCCNGIWILVFIWHGLGEWGKFPFWNEMRHLVQHFDSFLTRVNFCEPLKVLATKGKGMGACPLVVCPCIPTPSCARMVVVSTLEGRSLGSRWHHVWCCPMSNHSTPKLLEEFQDHLDNMLVAVVFRRCCRVFIKNEYIHLVLFFVGKSKVDIVKKNKPKHNRCPCARREIETNHCNNDG